MSKSACPQGPISTAGAAGNFELNVMLPLIGRNLLESLTFLANASRLLADRCVDGITADEQRCLELAQSSPAIATALNRYLGYEEVAAIVKASCSNIGPSASASPGATSMPAT